MSGANAFTPEEVDFLAQVTSPFADVVDYGLDSRQVTASRALLAEETRSLAGEMRTEHTFAEIIGRSLALTSVLQDVETVAPTEATVLVLGETGTGAGTAMAVVMHFTPIYPLALGGFTVPGYTALYTVLLNLTLATALTPVCNAMRGGRTLAAETVSAE